jgi:hypothetical protein
VRQDQCRYPHNYFEPKKFNEFSVGQRPKRRNGLVVEN